MPPLSSLPGHIKYNRFLRALARLGFIIDKTGGDGSHALAEYKNHKSITIPYYSKIPKEVLYYLLKEIEDITKGEVTWELINKEL